MTDINNLVVESTLISSDLSPLGDTPVADPADARQLLIELPDPGKTSESAGILWVAIPDATRPSGFRWGQLGDEAVTLDIFVSPTGSDSNSGRSPATAVQTPQAAVDAAYAGPTPPGSVLRIHFAPGMYTQLALLSNPDRPGVLLEFLGAFQNVGSTGVNSSPVQVADNTVGGLPAGDFFGKEIHVLSGPATGQVLLVMRQPTPGNAIVNGHWNGGPLAAGTQFTIEEPSVVLNCSDGFVPSGMCQLYGIKVNTVAHPPGAVCFAVVNGAQVYTTRCEFSGFKGCSFTAADAGSRWVMGGLPGNADVPLLEQPTGVFLNCPNGTVGPQCQLFIADGAQLGGTFAADVLSTVIFVGPGTTGGTAFFALQTIALRDCGQGGQSSMLVALQAGVLLQGGNGPSLIYRTVVPAVTSPGLLVIDDGFIEMRSAVLEGYSGVSFFDGSAIVAGWGTRIYLMDIHSDPITTNLFALTALPAAAIFCDTSTDISGTNVGGPLQVGTRTVAPYPPPPPAAFTYAALDANGGSLINAVDNGQIARFP